MVLIGIAIAGLIGRLYMIQVLSTEYESRAKLYSRKTKTVVPPRGNMYNRYGQIYVSNRAMFDLLITYRELSIPDTTLLCQLLEMPVDSLRKTIATAKREFPNKEFPLARNIDPKLYGKLRENLWNFNGISYSVTNARHYQYPVGANFLGFIREVDPADIKASEGYFVKGDLKGKSGIESSYEKALHGKKGSKEILKDKYGREVGSFNEGKQDVMAVKGSDLLLGIDTDLQGFGEILMQNKKGSIVAIEPSSGEILAFVSAPSYNPNHLTGREFYPNWRRLTRDTLKPLFNRPLMATYPPGSIYKTVMALAALNEGVITPNTYYICGGGFWRNRGKPGCRLHPHPLKLAGGIKYSCNAYFAATYMDFLNHKKFKDVYESFNLWHTYMDEFGLGRELELDLPYEGKGLLPTSGYYDRIYGETRWGATNIISNSIGQGEILMTPLQMANMVALIANKGFYYQPHFVKAKLAYGVDEWEKIHYKRNTTSVRPEHFQTVIDAMEDVVATGTARRAFIDDIVVCGKTGTVENPHGEDHATFIGFAPKDKPRIAVAVIIENSGGGGGRWAAPTAALMIEMYIRRVIEKKLFEYNRIKEADFIH